MARSKVKSRSHHDAAHLHPLANVSTKYQLKKNSMSLGLVVLEEKLFTQARTRMPQSDDIMSAD